MNINNNIEKSNSKSNKQIPIKKALKMWIGEKYIEHDYERNRLSRYFFRSLYGGWKICRSWNKSFIDKFGRGRYPKELE